MKTAARAHLKSRLKKNRLNSQIFISSLDSIVEDEEPTEAPPRPSTPPVLASATCPIDLDADYDAAATLPLYDRVLGISITNPDKYDAQLNSALRTKFPSAMTFRGSWSGNENLRILIDSGSTSFALVNKATVPLSDETTRRASNMQLRLLTGAGVIKHTALSWNGEKLSVQGQRIEMDELVQAELNSLPYDIILGMPFLQKYDPSPSWRTGNLRFTHGSKTRVWKRHVGIETEPTMNFLNCHQAVHEANNGGEMFLLTASDLVSNDASAEAAAQSNDPKDLIQSPEITIDSRIDPSVPQEQRQQLIDMFNQFKDVENPLFVTRDDLPALDKTPKKPKEWEMELPFRENYKSWNSGQRRFSEEERTEIKRTIDYLLEHQFIRPSMSRFASAVLLVKKKSGEWRFCIDLRALNNATYHGVNPIPDIRVLTSQLSKAKYLSTLDMINGFWQVPLSERHKYKTAFTTPFGLFEWNVVCFGIAGAPSHFQKILSSLVGPLTPHAAYTLNMMDDILIHSQTFDEHLEHLRAVMTTLHENHIFLYLKKCEIAAKKVVYLGNVVGGGERAPDPLKKSALLDHPEPRTATELRAFLGIGNYLSVYIPRWADMTQCFGSLRSQPKKATIELNAEQRQAFAKIKEVLASEPILKLPDFDKPFYVQLDASKTGIGSCLLQKYDSPDGPKLCPVAFRSTLPTKAQLKWPIHELELYALIDACKHFRQYIGDRLFYALSDHKPLEHLRNQENLSMRQIRYLDFLAMYDYEFMYIPGEENIFADPLSRPPGHVIDYEAARPSFNESNCRLCRQVKEDEALEMFDAPLHSGIPGFPTKQINKHTCKDHQAPDTSATRVTAAFMPVLAPLSVEISGIDDLDLDAVRNAYMECDFCKEVLPILKTKDSRHHYKKKYVLEDGLIYLAPNEYESSYRLCLPDADDIRNKVIKIHHDIPSEAHAEAGSTYLRVRERFFFPNMYRHIQKYVQTCDKCLLNKYSPRKPQGLLQPLEYPSSQPYQDIATDFATDLPSSKSSYTGASFDAVQVLVDRLSRRVRLVPSRKSDTAEATARNFAENVFPFWGMPKSIVSDRDPKFVADFYQALAKILGTRLRFTSSHNPQADGQSEKMVGVISTMLRIFVNYNQNNWVEHLGLFEFAVNRHASRARGELSPFMITNGFNPFSVADLAINAPQKPNKKQKGAIDYAKRQQLAAKLAQDAIIAGQDVAARTYNKSKREHTYKVGDRVLLRKDHVFPPGERERESYKLRETYVGPFKIIQLIGPNAVKLELYSKMRNHPVFSVRSTKPYPADVRRHRAAKVPDEDGIQQATTSLVLKMKLRYKRRLWLTRWQGFESDLAEERQSWLTFDDLCSVSEDKKTMLVNDHLKDFEQQRTGLLRSWESWWQYPSQKPGSTFSAPDGFEIYTSYAGESLFSIAKKLSVPLHHLWEQNAMGYGEDKLTLKSKLEKGTQLRLPRFLPGHDDDADSPSSLPPAKRAKLTKK